MPQLEFHTFAGQLFWLAICFIALYITVAKVILPRISGVLENRGQIISERLAEAESFKNKAESLALEQNKLLTETGERARKLIEESSAKAKHAVDQKRAALALKLDDKLAKAEKEIAKIEKESLVAIDKVSDELTDLIVSKFTSESRAA